MLHFLRTEDRHSVAILFDYTSTTTHRVIERKYGTQVHTSQSQRIGLSPLDGKTTKVVKNRWELTAQERSGNRWVGPCSAENVLRLQL